MNVNKYIFTKKKMADEPYVEIPIELTHTLLDRTDAIETNFIDVEVKKAIGTQEDIEFSKVNPKHNSDLSMVLDVINVDIELTNNGNNITTYLSHLGLEYEDLEYRSNRFKRTFLRFEYFDTDDIQTQRKIGEHTMFLNLLPEYYNTSLLGLLTGGTTLGSLKQPNACRLRFKAYNPKNHLNSVSEGYNFFLPRKEIGEASAPNIIYMRVSLNSAVSGISHRLCTSKTSLPIDQLVDKLHIPLQVKWDNNQPICIYNYGTVSTNTKTLTMTFYECISQ